MAKLEATLATLPSKADALRSERDESLASLRAFEAARANKLREMEASLNELTRGVVMYKFLGLEFQRADNDQLLIRFTHLDPKDWSREFSFRVGLGPDDAYRVDGCAPPIKTAVLSALLTRLNAPNEVDAMEFPGFVVEMRRTFKSLI